MTRCTPTELAARIGAGLLSFPVTHFRADDLSFDEPGYRDHLAWLGGHDVAGLFAAGGTGEFFSLTLDEVGAVVAAAVASAPDGVPVLAPTGYGTATAVELARAAHAAGADGLLLFPPYLTEADQEGLAAHVRAVCAATPLGVVVYSRGNAVYAPATVAALAAQCPTLVGFKDGVGDLEAITRLHSLVGDRLTYVGGLPTAETFALPYLELGVTTYSSAIFNVLPELALAFHAAVRRRDRPTVRDLLDRVVLPWTAVRDRRRGYAVSIVKAGMDAVGRSAGPVRPPLVGLTADERADLAAIIAVARDHVAAPA